jgi:hypothetical protein
MDGTLVMQVTADDEAALTVLEDVVARHLVRFAFRDPPENLVDAHILTDDTGPSAGMITR